MIRKIFLVLSFSVFVFSSSSLAMFTEQQTTTENILATAHSEKPTTCAATVFSNALIEHSNEVSPYDDEARVRTWARETMQAPDVLEQVLNCPEIKTIADDTTIIFTPIVYEFKNSDNKTIRTITVNYSTQPKVIKQKILLSRKRSLPNGDANPNLMDFESGAKYLNTEPAWYAIMVVQHDALKDFVGKGKNNTLSMKYLYDHIDEIYPHGYYCTSKSAIANNHDTINKVVKKVVDIEDDTNDYYVAGDVNLEWVMYAEVAADILIFAATAGGGQLALWFTKEARAGRLAKNFKTVLQTLRSDENVIKYMKTTNQIKRNEDAVEKIKNAKKLLPDLRKKYQKAVSAGKEAEADELLRQITDISNDMKNLKIADIHGEAGALKSAQVSVVTLTQEEKTAEIIKEIEETTKRLNETAKTLSEANKSIQTYKDISDELGDFNKYRRALTTVKKPQTGNVITSKLKKLIPAFKSIKAANDGAKTMTKAGRAVRAGMSSRSAKIKDFLLDATLKHGSRLAKVEYKLGNLYGVATLIQIAGDMYDKTSTTSKEFSNGIEFKPLCLLSADDLKGQENVVNYGMWLMWMGNSTDMADDDAAYLQAMDFAAKFFYQLDEYQDEHGANCNVDIYVVRPIIRLDETNVDNPSGELFYLFMNEIPWSTAEQFDDFVPNITDWDRAQAQLNDTDPEHKYTSQSSVYSESTPERIAEPENLRLSAQDNAE